jgi:hypothetical protein
MAVAVATMKQPLSVEDARLLPRYASLYSLGSAFDVDHAPGSAK